MSDKTQSTPEADQTNRIKLAVSNLLVALAENNVPLVSIKVDVLPLDPKLFENGGCRVEITSTIGNDKFSANADANSRATAVARVIAKTSAHFGPLVEVPELQKKKQE